ncbi:hypothetical protein LguiB_013343 [Lonicera macranthoides]
MEARNGFDGSSVGSSVVSRTSTSFICPDELSGPSTHHPRERIKLSEPSTHRPREWIVLHGNFVIIRPKTSSTQTILNAESIEKIPEEEAICRFCNDAFKGENAVMLTCKCNKNTLAHESCRDQNNKNCDGCEQELQSLLVTLHLEPYSTHSTKHKSKKANLVSRLQRCICLGKGKVDDS